MNIVAADAAPEALLAIQSQLELRDAAARTRVTLLQWDVLEDAPELLLRQRADSALMFFVLSALHPRDHVHALRHVRTATAPGG